MTDKQQTEMLTDMLNALFAPLMKGNYLVSIRGEYNINANDRNDAITKAKEYYSTHIEELNFDAVKVDDIVKVIKENLNYE